MIKVNNLTKKFGGFTAVDNISFEVNDGEIFAFLGPNGAGKSTTIKILTSLLHPTEGMVVVNGFDPVHQSEEVRRSFGVVFQELSLDDDLTAFENMELHGVLYDVPKEIRKKRTEELLMRVNLWDRKDDQVKEFSGGMKRRLEIARAFLHHPKILYLDEPTLGLDPQTRSYMWTYLKELNNMEGTTIFFTTHYMEEADRNAQAIAIIDHGKIIAHGAPMDLKEQTYSTTLEGAFLALTGKTIREQAAESADNKSAMRFSH